MPNWSRLATEQTNPSSRRIDELSTLEMLQLINTEDALVAPAIREALPAIARAVDMAHQSLDQGGRLFYMGAGTSGRLGILDASECPPTFSSDPKLVQGLIAGGTEAVFQAVEGAEDKIDDGANILRERELSPPDMVVGIAASGVTPFVLGGLQYARSLNCSTAFITCSQPASPPGEGTVIIAPQVGPEILTGSTRLKAGTATKMVLNMISTGAMIKWGKTYGHFMVDLQPKNAKLRDRSQRILAAIADISEAEAEKTLDQASGHLKVALVMVLCQIDQAEANKRLEKHRGLVKKAIGAID
ncbi:MAG: N-acetylmuramic acid 6-phosphate etherase [Candidatus Latescibacteria bacterium]|nr:N-acetylmuramic acid 6-phosphate etherase [Candidatus Latescibacterota bacterium]